jgi:hypothetical protein
MRTARLFLLLVVTVGTVLALTTDAFAAPTFEQASTFPIESSAFVRATAVNETGAGGVEPGTVYAVGREGNGSGSKLWVLEKTGELINAVDLPVGLPVGIAVDRATGDLAIEYGGNVVAEIRSPNGLQSVTTFGEPATAADGEIGESPAKVHSIIQNGIAIGEGCAVYLSDLGPAGEIGGQHSRILRFSPQTPGICSNYSYAGQSADITAFRKEEGGGVLATDAHGNIYSAGPSSIYRFSLNSPGAPSCTYKVPGNALLAMTVNPLSEEVFYASQSDSAGHQLSCVGSAFQVSPSTTKFAITPPPSGTLFVGGFSFNGTASFAAGRPAGVLYGGNEHGLGYIFSAPIEHQAPAIEATFVSNVTSTSAVLNTRINPKGSSVRYVFQYVSEAAYEANPEGERFTGGKEVPTGGAALGEAAQVALQGSAVATGLTPGTTYRYRVVAVAGTEVSVGAVEAFRTFPILPPGLADGRRYELVSPSLKNGGEVLPANPGISSCGCGKPGFNFGRFPTVSAPDGEAVAYEGQPFSVTQGGIQENEYLSRRSPTGWETTTLTSPLQESGEERGLRALSENLAQGVIYQGTQSLSPAGPPFVPNLYTFPTGSPESTAPLLKVGQAFNREAAELKLTYVGASKDFSRVFFEANDALTGETPFAPAAEDGGRERMNLYEWSPAGLALVNVEPGNVSSAPGGSVGAPKQGQGERKVAFVTHAISADGSRVFWTSEAGKTFVRIDGKRTLEIPGVGDCRDGSAAIERGHCFVNASADGSKVLMSDGEIYSINSGETAYEPAIDLTTNEEGVHEGTFQGLVGANEELSQVYFVASASLTGGAEAGTCEKAGSGQAKEEEEVGLVPPGFGCNLYSWGDGGTSLIGTVLASDDEAGSGWSGPIPYHTAETSPNGEWLAFLSMARLTGQDEVGPCSFSRSVNGREFFQHACSEVFLYNAPTGRLVCASCSPAGAPPLGNAHLPTTEGANASTPQLRYLTDSGRLFFDSQDSLVPGDTNGGGPPGLAVEDVYEYEQAGYGTCSSPFAEGGCLSLISAGSGTGDSNFLASDSSGRNVFFTTRDRLTPSDTDELIDLYDAREGGGLPVTEPQPGCLGEGCQTWSAPPAEAAPSSTRASELPAASAKCKKGLTFQKGRCVKKPVHNPKKKAKRHLHNKAHKKNVHRKGKSK